MTFPVELQALSDTFARSGLHVERGWLISLPSILVHPGEEPTGGGYLVAQFCSGAGPDVPAFWGPGAVRLGRADQVQETAGVVCRDVRGAAS